jgi:hypothetical protein
MKPFTRLAVTAAIGGTALLMPLSAANAAPAQLGGRYCATLVAPAGSTTPANTFCSDVSRAAAKAGLTATATMSSRSSARPAVTYTLLATYFENAGFTGTHGDLYGAYGTCDHAGYQLPVSPYWSQEMSSIAGAGHCIRVRISNRALTVSQFFPLSKSFGGTQFNDNVGAIHVDAG